MVSATLMVLLAYGLHVGYNYTDIAIAFLLLWILLYGLRCLFEGE